MEHVLTSPRLMSILYSFHAPVQAVFSLTKIPPFTVSPLFQFVFQLSRILVEGDVLIEGCPPQPLEPFFDGWVCLFVRLAATKCAQF